MIIDFDEQSQTLVIGYSLTDWLMDLENTCYNIYNYANYTLPAHLSINQPYVKE